MAAESLGEALVEIGGDLDGLKDALKKAEMSTRDATSKMSTAIKVGLAGAVAAAGVAIGGLGVSSVKTFAGFEKAMSEVKAVSGASDEQFATLTETVKTLGSETQFTAQQVANASAELAKSGFQTDKLIGALPQVLDLAAAAGTSIETAADITTNIMQGFNIGVDQLQETNDVLVKAFNSSAIGLQELGESFQYVGPVAATAGLSFTETAAAIAELGNAGLKGSEAGTSLRGIIASLLSPSKKAAQALHLYGVEVTDANGKMRSLADIIGQFTSGSADLGKKIHGLSDEFGDVNGLAAEFATRFQTAVDSAVDAGDKLSSNDIVLFTDEVAQSFGFAGKQAGGFAAAIKNAFAGTGATLVGGQEDVSAFRKVLADTFAKLQNGAVATGDLMTIFGREAGPGMASLLTQGSEGLKQMTASLKDSQGITQKIADVQMDNLAGAFELLSGAVDGVKLAIGEELAPVLRSFAEWLTDHMPQIKAVVVGAFDGIATSLEWLFNTGLPAASKALGTVKAAFGKLAAALSPVFTALKPVGDWVKENSDIVIPALATAIGVVLVPTFYTLATAIGAMMVAAAPVTALILGITAAITGGILIWKKYGDNIKKFFIGAINAVVDLIKSAPKRFADGAKAIMLAFIQGLQSMVSKIPFVGEKIAKTLGDYLIGQSPPPKGPLSKIDQGGANIIQAWVDGILSKRSAVEKAVDALTGAAKERFDEMKSMAQSLANVMQSAFGAMAKTIGSTGNWWKGAKAGLKELVVGILGAIEAQVVAMQAAGVAAAWASAPLTFGASLALLGPMAATLAAFEAAKAVAVAALAEGGTITSPGTVLVGERGPELLNLPRGASVIPLNHRAATSGGGTATIIVELDGHTIARVVGAPLIDLVRVKTGLRI